MADDQYLPPAGDQLGFDLTGEGYVAPVGNHLGFDFRYRPPYIPPKGDEVPLTFSLPEGQYEYLPPQGHEVGLEFVPDSEKPPVEDQFITAPPYTGTMYGIPDVRNESQWFTPVPYRGTTYGVPEIWTETL